MVRPLTKKDKDGVLYTRPASIQKEIQEALALDDTSDLVKKAKNLPGSPDFMTSECLVHIIREHYRQGNDRLANPLLLTLLARCKANLEKTVPNNRMVDAETVREDILGKFGIMFAEDARGQSGSRLDFFEIKFNRAFQTLRVDMVRAEIKQRSELLDVHDGTDGEENLSHEDRIAQLSVMARQEATQHDDYLYKQILKMASGLPTEMRMAFFLCRIMGYTQEAAAEKCGVSVKTIYNRLNAAEQKIKKI